MVKAAYSIEGFARFIRQLRLEDGSTMKLLPYERLALADHFDGVVETVIILPKKNGKTTLLGALALYHLANWPDAEVVIGAASRDQARILFRQAAGLVTRSGLEDRFDVRSGYGEIRLGGKDGPRIRVLAADAHTADGVIPTLALVDELHRHPSADLYGVFRDGLGPRGGRMITISTAGASLASPLGELRQRAHALPGFRREGAHNYARTEDLAFAFHEWCLAPGDDVHDMAVVKEANPAPWHTLEALQRRHDSPSTTPAQWARFACGLWTEGDEPWIDPARWDALAEPGLRLDPDLPSWFGIDVGVRHDTTSIAIVQQRPDQTVVAQAVILEPTEREPVTLTKVEQVIRDLADELRPRWIAYDPWSFRRSAELLEASGLPMLEYPQTPERMAHASAALYTLIEGGTLRHSGDPKLRAHVLAAVTKETERGWRLVKNPATRRPIDAVIALAVAIAAMGSPPEPARTPVRLLSLEDDVGWEDLGG